MKALRTCLIALVASAAFYATATMLVAAAPAMAQMPPGWTPGTFYRNISNNPTADPAASVMPDRKPTDPPDTPPNNVSIWAGWTTNGFVAQPPSSSDYSAAGQYCTDDSGGQVYVAAGAPIDPDLSCPSTPAGS